MPAHLYLAPAGYGKSSYALGRARAATAGLRYEVRVCVASKFQQRAWHRRLAAEGGALGVHVQTFGGLYRSCLDAAGEIYTALDESQRFRVIRSVVDGLALKHYAPVAATPGFIQALDELLRELKAAQILPATFLAGAGATPRLRELGLIYAAYQERLQAQRWADESGLGWMAVEALQERAMHVARDWPLLIVDGFDNFTVIQTTLLQLLAERAGELVITLTGADAPYRSNEADCAEEAAQPAVRRAHRRFAETCCRLEQALQVRAAPLPATVDKAPSPLTHLEATLFEPAATPVAPGDAVTLVAAPTPAAEARAAMRWVKQRIIHDGMAPAELAIVARDMSGYRAHLQEVAAEFGVPVHFADGLPLAQNPAIAALLALLRLFLPESGAQEPSLPRRGVVAAWRSPYFDWEQAVTDGVPVGIQRHDAARLDLLARWGRVTGGWDQWDELLRTMERITADTGADEERGRPLNLPDADEAAALHDKFVRFVAFLMPPPSHTLRGYVRWLEDLIGEERAGDRTDSLNIFACASRGPATAAADIGALRTLKQVLRGLIWAEQTAPAADPLTFSHFFEELQGAVETSTYQRFGASRGEAVLVARVARARGVPVRAVALLGLAEDVFPQLQSEDPLLREQDREQLRAAGLPVLSALASNERELFYETVTRPQHRLLVTRPRLDDRGNDWLPSPFWEEMERLLHVTPQLLQTEDVIGPGNAASWGELMESLVMHHQDGNVGARGDIAQGARWRRLGQASGIFRDRYAWAQRVEHDGDLSGAQPTFARHFDVAYAWSASRLESYRMCPFSFFVGNVLALEPRPEPVEGLDARQLGTIYHRILEKVFRRLAPVERGDSEAVLAVLPQVAAEVLDAAPRREGFRATAWWTQTREEIIANVRRTLEKLLALDDGFRPVAFEVWFGGDSALHVGDNVDGFRLRGIVDRIDRNERGEVRVIDYKTAGPHSYQPRNLETGERIQLPLYAAAAQDALRYGPAVDGFYWHVRHGEPSRLRLAEFGVAEALSLAVAHAEEAVNGARAGAFRPQPPAGGCPSYCAAAAWCWRYRRGYQG